MDLDFEIAVLDKFLDLENQLANAKAGAGDPIFLFLKNSIDPG